MKRWRASSVATLNRNLFLNHAGLDEVAVPFGSRLIWPVLELEPTAGQNDSSVNGGWRDHTELARYSAAASKGCTKGAKGAGSPCVHPLRPLCALCSRFPVLRRVEGGLVETLTRNQFLFRVDIARAFVRIKARMDWLGTGRPGRSSGTRAWNGGTRVPDRCEAVRGPGNHRRLPRVALRCLPCRVLGRFASLGRQKHVGQDCRDRRRGPEHEARVRQQG
jgi:hypothetical protein